MLARRRLRTLGAALVLLGLAPALERPAHSEPAAASPEPSPAPARLEAAEASPRADPGAVLDVVLPCGLRVLAAQDISLPVAAVILAVEAGSEDDPPESPGLVHALAYHLHQGNRELRPGETIAAAQDAGGIHMLATGPGQVRFESLVPISRLDEVLFAESQRLRHPTLDRRRWEISLGWAASDVRSRPGLRPQDLAELHGAPGLAHDGRAPNRALAEIAPASLAVALASRFNYSRSTLIVVAPEPPATILEQVRARFDDLPAAPRSVPTRPQPPPRAPLSTDPAAPSPSPAATGAKSPASPAALGTNAPGPASLGAKSPLPPASRLVLGAILPATPASSATLASFLEDQGAPSPAPAAPAPAAAPGTPPPAPAASPVRTPAPARPVVLAWPVAADGAAAAWAGVLCRAFNRQKRDPDEPRKARIACDYDTDPRRGHLIVRPLGTDDPLGLVRARLARLGGGDQPLVTAQAQFVAQMTRLYIRTPLGLARRLAASDPSPRAPAPGDIPVRRQRDALTGLASLAGPPALTLAVEDALLIGPAEPKKP